MLQGYVDKMIRWVGMVLDLTATGSKFIKDPPVK